MGLAEFGVVTAVVVVLLALFVTVLSGLQAANDSETIIEEVMAVNFFITFPSLVLIINYLVVV
jgi:hypothetical protein